MFYCDDTSLYKLCKNLDSWWDKEIVYKFKPVPLADGEYENFVAEFRYQFMNDYIEEDKYTLMNGELRYIFRGQKEHSLKKFKRSLVNRLKKLYEDYVNKSEDNDFVDVFEKPLFDIPKDNKPLREAYIREAYIRELNAYRLDEYENIIYFLKDPVPKILYYTYTTNEDTNGNTNRNKRRKTVKLMLS